MLPSQRLMGQASLCLGSSTGPSTPRCGAMPTRRALRPISSPGPTEQARRSSSTASLAPDHSTESSAKRGAVGRGRLASSGSSIPSMAPRTSSTGTPAFSISIAACDANGALVGVVHDPLRRETFTAMRGGGSFCNGQPIPGPRVVPPLSEALIATGFGYSPRLRANQAEILGRVLPGIRDIRRGGSAALDLCSVAVGRVDAYYEAGLGRWDREAGVLVATEAGRVIRDHPGIIDDEVTLVVAPPGLIGPLCALLEAARGG